MAPVSCMAQTWGFEETVLNSLKEAQCEAQNPEQTLHHWNPPPSLPCPAFYQSPSIFANQTPPLRGGSPPGSSSSSDPCQPASRSCCGRNLAQEKLPRGASFSHSFFSFFFFFFFVFLGPHPWHVEVPRLGVNQSYSCQPTPQPQQRGIQAASSAYTTALGNAGSLTH